MTLKCICSQNFQSSNTFIFLSVKINLLLLLLFGGSALSLPDSAVGFCLLIIVQGRDFSDHETTESSSYLVIRRADQSIILHRHQIQSSSVWLFFCFQKKKKHISTDHISNFQCANTHRASHLMFFGLRRHLLRDEFDGPLDLPPRPLRAIR